MTAVESVMIFTTRNKFLSLFEESTIYQNCVFCINEEDQNGKLNQYVNQGNFQNCYVHYTGLVGGKIITSGSIQDQFSSEFKKTNDKIEIDKDILYEKLYGLSYLGETLGVKHDNTLKVEDNTNQLGVNVENLLANKGGIAYDRDYNTIYVKHDDTLSVGDNNQLQVATGNLLAAKGGIEHDKGYNTIYINHDNTLDVNNSNQLQVVPANLLDTTSTNTNAIQTDTTSGKLFVPYDNTTIQMDGSTKKLKVNAENLLQSGGGLGKDSSGKIKVNVDNTTIVNEGGVLKVKDGAGGGIIFF